LKESNKNIFDASRPLETILERQMAGESAQ